MRQVCRLLHPLLTLARSDDNRHATTGAVLSSRPKVDVTCNVCRVLRRDLSIKMRLRAKKPAGE